jgi:hypothetical protein
LASDQDNIHSILAADIGSVFTRAVLIDEVDGEFRLMARAQVLTTAEPPISDTSVGLGRALTEIGSLMGRTFYSANEGVLHGDREDGEGADVFIATASGGRPMKALIVGLTPDISLISGRRALGSTYIDVVGMVNYSDNRSTEENVNLILSQHPDLIVIVGGTDFGALEPMRAMLRTVQLALELAHGNPPAILYAGNQALRPLAAHLLSDKTSTFLTRNVRPGLSAEDLRAAELELSLVYGEYVTQRVGGFTEIQEASEMGVLATAQSYSNVIRYLGGLPGNGGVLLIDVGSSTTTLCASINRQAYVDIRNDLGLGHSAVTAMNAINGEDIRRWLSSEISDNDLQDYAWNKSARPSSAPQTGADLEIEYAMARELIRLIVKDSRGRWKIPESAPLPPMRQIIGAGSLLAQAINPGIGALIILDALQPTGIVRLQLDPYGVIPALGGIAYTAPKATVQVLENGGLLDIGTAICPTGRPPSGTAITATITYTNGRSEKHVIAGGQIKTVSLPVGQKAQVTMRMGRGMRLNGRANLSMQLEGGAAGLIFDARGRPFYPPKKVEDRKAALQSWYAGVRG